MKTTQSLGALGLTIAIVMGLTGCGQSKSNSYTSNHAKPDTSSSSSSSSSNSSSSTSSSSTSSSSSSSTSSSSGRPLQIISPLDAVTGLLPTSTGLRNHNPPFYGEYGRPGKFHTIYAAVNVGSSRNFTLNREAGYLTDQHGEITFSADQHYIGGDTVNRVELVKRQEIMAWDAGYSGRIFKNSHTARTGKFVYEIPLEVKSAAVEIHIVPFQDEPYTDIEFSLKIEDRDRISTTFAYLSSSRRPPIQGFTFLDVVVMDGKLTLEFDLPSDYFGVSTIFVSDYDPASGAGRLDCTELGICQLSSSN